MSMRRFTVETISAKGSAARVGLWEAGNGSTVQTPAVWVGTRCGAIPSLTPETFERLKGVDFAGLLVPFQHHSNRLEVIEKYSEKRDGGVAAYYGYPNHDVLVAPQDPLTPSRTGYHTNKYISLWDNSDRMKVTPSIYERGLKAMKPDAFVVLCDGDTPKNASNNRVSKATSGSLQLLDQCLLDCSLDPRPFLFASVQGGFDSRARKVSATEVGKRSGVDGYFLDGFHQNEADAMRDDLAGEMVPILKDVLAVLPAAKPKLYHGMCPPPLLLELVSLGVDMFESSYAVHLAEKGRALTFPNAFGDSLQVPLEAVPFSESVDLGLKLHKDDFGPLAKGCGCYTCGNHSRAYVNHLLATNELLAPILVTLHNLHHYGTFFATIRKFVAAGKLDSLRQVFCSGKAE